MALGRTAAEPTSAHDATSDTKRATLADGRGARPSESGLIDDLLLDPDSFVGRDVTVTGSIVRLLSRYRLRSARGGSTLMIDLEGFTYASVAEILEIPVGTVMSRLCRGRRALKEHLIDVGTAATPRRSATLKRVK